MGRPVFELEDAGVRFGDTEALAGVSVSVESGERVAVIGPSGAGKSSLIRLLNGTLVPDSGRVRVLGEDLAGASARKLRGVQRRLGTIHQQFDLVDQLRVVHNVNAGRLAEWPLWRAAASLASPRETATARQALARVGIADKLYERTATLSGGEQQRVAIARVLVQRPAAILADEPIASLDPARGLEIVRLLCEVSRELGTTLLASLHDVEVALASFHRIVGLREGGVVFDCAPARVSPDAIEALYSIEREGGLA